MDLNRREEGRTPVTLGVGVNRESGPSNSEALCNFCKRTFNFGLVGFKPTSRSLIRRRAIRLILKESKTCDFCRELAKFYNEWRGGKLDKGIFDVQVGQIWGNHWVDFSLHKEKRLMIDDALNNLDINSMTPSVNRIRVLFNNPDSCNYFASLQFQYCSQPPLLVSNGGSICNWEKCAQEQAYSGRIRPLLADTRLFREWKETCCTKHGDPCNLISAGTRPPWLRFIDVKDRCVKDIVIKDGSSYATLSYVWGKHELGQKLMPELGKSTENRFRKPRSLIRETVLSTIDDAIEVAQSLGEKYLWVDCLCIRQDDKADQGKFILQMDSIYAHASVTIVAASGSNADAGLPGIKQDSRTCEQQPFPINGNGVWLLQTLDPVGTKGYISDDYWYLEDSVWCERGWTFQEKIFSRKALIFTKEQVYWECQKATWCEDGFWETMQPPTVYRSCTSDHFRRPWASDTQKSFEEIYLKLVREYCRRKLTNGSDGLDAFRGILNALKREASQNFLWALPTSSFSKMITWCCEERSIKRREEMCPVRSSDGTSDCPFPSWSWVGWMGVIDSFDSETSDLIFYYLDGERQLQIVEEVTPKSRSQNAESTERHVTLEEIPESVLSQSIDKNILFFWSTTAKLLVRHEGLNWDGHGNLILSHNDEDVMCSWYHTPELKEDDKEMYDFVFIGNTVYNRTAILLVVWKDGVAYRRGLATLDAALWEGLDSLEWKMISLG